MSLTLAVLPIWVLPSIFPPPPIEETAIGIAKRFKDRVVAKVGGTEGDRPVRRSDASDVWYDRCQIAAVSLGLLAIAGAAAAFLRREDRRYAGVAMALGASAIAFQIAWIVFAAILLLVLILGVLNSVFG